MSDRLLLMIVSAGNAGAATFGSPTRAVNVMVAVFTGLLALAVTRGP